MCADSKDIFKLCTHVKYVKYESVNICKKKRRVWKYYVSLCSIILLFFWVPCWRLLDFEEESATFADTLAKTHLVWKESAGEAVRWGVERGGVIEKC